MAHCARCGTTEDSEFYPSQLKGTKGGWCKRCMRKYYRRKVKKDRDYFVKYQRKRRVNVRDSLTELKVKVGCMKCGEKHPACLDFHHSDEYSKAFPIARATQNKKIALLMAETKKCVVMCSNCHRKLHYEEKSGQFRPKRKE